MPGEMKNNTIEKKAHAQNKTHLIHIINYNINISLTFCKDLRIIGIKSI